MFCAAVRVHRALSGAFLELWSAGTVALELLNLEALLKDSRLEVPSNTS